MSNLIQNPSLCVYIGNISSISDQNLISYVSKYGQILSYLNEKRAFCDFRIIEFSTEQELDSFLQLSNHQIDSLTLDIRLYKDLLTNFDLLNLNRRCFLGPIINPHNINTIIQFYKLIDPNLNYFLTQQNQLTYLLIEFFKPQYIQTIIQQNTLPKTLDNQIYTIHLPIHPKELIEKTLSCQIYIHGLTEQITENVLM